VVALCDSISWLQEPHAILILAEKKISSATGCPKNKGNSVEFWEYHLPLRFLVGESSYG